MFLWNIMRIWWLMGNGNISLSIITSNYFWYECFALSSDAPLHSAIKRTRNGAFGWWMKLKLIFSTMFNHRLFNSLSIFEWFLWENLQRRFPCFIFCCSAVCAGSMGNWIKIISSYHLMSRCHPISHSIADEMSFARRIFPLELKLKWKQLSLIIFPSTTD